MASTCDEDALDVFEAGLRCVFLEPAFALGNPGSEYSHQFSTPHSSPFRPVAAPNPPFKHEIAIHVPAPQNPASTQLMAHFIWQSAFALSREVASGRFDLRNAVVVELGAGAGLCGLVAALSGARVVLASDYPDEGIVRALTRNLENVLGAQFRYLPNNEACGCYWDVIGHEWGTEDSMELLQSRIPATISATSPIVILLADLLWIPTAHAALLSDVRALLARSNSPHSKALVAAGLHTGRDAIDAFFKKARELFGFTVVKLGEVRVGVVGIEDGIVNIGEDVSEERRETERRDPTERKKWVFLYEMFLVE